MFFLPCIRLEQLLQLYKIRKRVRAVLTGETDAAVLEGLIGVLVCRQAKEHFWKRSEV